MDLGGSLLLCDVGGRELANWRPGGKSCSLMPLSLGPPAQTPCLIYLCIYLPPPPPPIPTQDLRTHQRFTVEKKRGKERKRGGEGERKRERKGNLCSVGINKALSN